MRESVKRSTKIPSPNAGASPRLRQRAGSYEAASRGPCCEASVRKAAALQASRAMLKFAGLRGTGCSAAGLEKRTPILLHRRFLWSRGSQTVTNSSRVAQQCLCRGGTAHAAHRARSCASSLLRAPHPLGLHPTGLHRFVFWGTKPFEKASWLSVTCPSQRERICHTR